MRVFQGTEPWDRLNIDEHQDAESLLAPDREGAYRELGPDEVTRIDSFEGAEGQFEAEQSASMLREITARHGQEFEALWGFPLARVWNVPEGVSLNKLRRLTKCPDDRNVVEWTEENFPTRANQLLNDIIGMEDGR